VVFVWVLDIDVSMDKIAEMTSASSSCVQGGLRVWLRVVEAADVLLEVDMVGGGVIK
jgi:hypothetical protein